MIVGLVELHGDEQKRKEMWGSDRLLVGEPLQVKEDGKAKDPASTKVGIIVYTADNRTTKLKMLKSSSEGVNYTKIEF